MSHIRSIRYFPEELKEQFIDISRRKNHIVLFVLAIVGIFVQGFNITRVLVFSNAKLSTLNNRIYFSFYLILFIISVLYLLNQIWLRKKEKLCYYFDSVCISIFIIWNAGLTFYDSYSAGRIETAAIIISFMFFGALFLHRPYFMISNLLVAYLPFLLYALYLQAAGGLVNITIAVILSGIMVVNRFFSTIADLKQKQNIADVNKLLKDEKERFQLTYEQYELFLKYAHDILFIWDLKNDSIEFSDNWHDIFGFPVNIQNFTLWLGENRVVDGKKNKDIVKLRETLQTGQIHKEEEILIKGATGTEAWYKIRVWNQFDYEGFPRFGVGMLNDITTQKEIIIGLEREIQKDPLTGILNKTAIELRINNILKKADNNKNSALLILDLDNFKGINDEFGHPCGDYVLLECTFILKNIFDREADFGRIGGDEFIVFAKDITDAMLCEACDMVIKEIQEIRWQGGCVNASCSIGVTRLTKDINEYAQLYYEADDAMYMAKRTGKGKFCVYPKTTSNIDTVCLNQ